MKGIKESGEDKEEIRTTVQRIKNDKAIGLDGGPGEIWKYGGEEMLDWFCKLVDEV